MRVLPNHRHDPPGLFPYFRRGKFDPLTAVRKVCTKVIDKSSEFIKKCLRYVWLHQKERNSTMMCSLMKDAAPKNEAVGPLVSLKKTHSSPPHLRSIVSTKYSGESRAQIWSFNPGKSSVEDIVDDLISEVIVTIDQKEHMEAVERLVEEMFQKAQTTLMEDVQNLHEIMDKHTEAHEKETNDINAKITKMEADKNDLEQTVTLVTTKCDQSLVEAETNRVSINRNKEEIESLKLKAVEHQRSIESMEVIKVEFASLKRKYSDDHNSLGQDIDKVRKKQKVHEARFADLEREVSLLKIQLQEAKKEDALKKEIDQLRGQIVQVEARLTVKLEQPAPASPMLSTPKCPKFFTPPTPSSCKGSGKSMQDDQNEAMVIFLNRASVKEIATLPAIGYKTAQLIYNHREMRGKFTSLMQIRNVPGINQTVFNKFLLQNQLTLF